MSDNAPDMNTYSYQTKEGTRIKLASLHDLGSLLKHLDTLQERREKLQMALGRQESINQELGQERDQLRAELASYDKSYRARGEELMKLRAELEATREDLNNVMLERNRLARELEALKPKPVVREVLARFDVMNGEPAFICTSKYNPYEDMNVKLTFTDGTLTKAEVIGD